MVPSKHSPTPCSGSLRSYTESDNDGQEVVRVRTSCDDARYCDKKLSAPCSISFDIGPAYYPRFLQKKSWEIESPEESESGSTHEPSNISPIVSPLVSPLTSSAESMTCTVSNQGPSQRDDESITEIDEATQRKSDLREQLEMERAKSSALKKERDDAVLCATDLKTKFDIVEKEKDDAEKQLCKTRQEISMLEKRRNGIFWGEKSALVQAERDQAITRESDSLELKQKAEKERDDALELVTRVYEFQKETLEERNEARRIALKRLKETEQAEKERDEAQRLAAESSKQTKQAQKLENEAEVRVGKLLWEKLLREGMQKERDEARRHLKEAEQRCYRWKRELDLLREEIEEMKGENKKRGWHRTSFLGALFD
ncbi:f47eab3c-2ea7-4ddd-be1b-b1276e819ad3-CDS [Sclerotinia trifoliorum]|uniref:F47eab3c-2ea7-4ddd-be1b-b1276e819ad3-CDS n=1 Tax=Sclerotinia trifoliorum TaxID=28548 RepID=A0A8H2ZRB8_9HELO|nr:f47eab3c-2ea7-4ddd-be1b-b1276e819ad3-CDS [Sclerotinia trifoliorum]